MATKLFRHWENRDDGGSNTCKCLSEEDLSDVDRDCSGTEVGCSVAGVGSKQGCDFGKKCRPSCSQHCNLDIMSVDGEVYRVHAEKLMSVCGYYMQQLVRIFA